MKQERNLENVTDNAITRFVIKGAFYGDKCFPGLNDLLHEAERHPKAYNDTKRKYQNIAVNAIRRDLRGLKAKGVVIPHYTFAEPRKGVKRDYDNICASGRKIINDALTKTGTIKDDSPEYLMYGTNTFIYVNEPFIEVVLEMVETPWTSPKRNY